MSPMSKSPEFQPCHHSGRVGREAWRAFEEVGVGEVCGNTTLNTDQAIFLVPVHVGNDAHPQNRESFFNPFFAVLFKESAKSGEEPIDLDRNGESQIGILPGLQPSHNSGPIDRETYRAF
jgi:hypothetical protein